MGLLSWIKGAPKSKFEDKRSRFIESKIQSATLADAFELAVACAGLSGSSAMVFGMVVGDVPDRDQLRDLALEKVRGFVPELADAQCDAVFDMIARANLPIDVEARRRRLITDRATALASTASRVRTMLRDAAAGPLVDACGALGGFQNQVMGIAFQGDEAMRRELLAQGLARLATLIPTLSDEAFEDVDAVIRRNNLAIDVTARRAEVTSRRRTKHAEAIASASGTEPHNDELERAIDAHPDDPDPYSVLADWLHDRGHPRGELVQLQLRAESDPTLQAAALAHLTSHDATLLGPLSAHKRTHDTEDRPAFTWRRGFIDRVLLSNDDYPKPCDTSNAEILGLLFAHPSGRRVSHIAFGMDGSDDTLDHVIEAVVANAPSTLRSLLLGDYTYEQCMVSSYEIGKLAPLWTMTTLRELVVYGVFETGTIDHPLLERVQFQTGGLSPASAQAIARARLPKLRHLDVWYGDPNYGGDATITDVLPLIARTDFPELTHLGLMNAAFTDEICEQLPMTAIAQQLRELDLSMGTMSDAGAAALVAAAKKLPRLVKLDVSQSYLSDEAIFMLRGEFKEVIATDQRETDTDEDDRYPSVGE